MGKRVMYGLVGYGIGTAIVWVAHGGRHFGNAANIGIVGGSVAIWLGERSGRLKPLEEVNRPISLFPDGVPGPR